MKRFINSRQAVVRDAIDGLLLGSAGAGLCRLDDPDINVVLRRDWKRDRVALVSGGGSGHEPAHAGFVGPGMLTAAVCGDIFASPSVDAVLAAILAVTGGAGCLLIVKNYTGDRLNFGLAAERARAAGLAVETVIAADDVALADGISARGLAGTLFVHKLAGAAAQAGQSLEAVAAVARDAALHVRSIGLSLSDCTPPGSEPSDRLGAEDAELGLGIHGEPGAAVIPMGSADALVAQAFDRLRGRGHDPDARYALLLNNLGSTPPLEMAILMGSVVRVVPPSQLALVIGPGSFMTSLDMAGFSLSLLELDAAREALLLAPTALVAWQQARPGPSAAIVPVPAGLEDQVPSPSRAPRVQALVEAGTALFIAIEGDLNALDARVGDGDTGTTFAQAADSVRRHLEVLPYADGAALLRRIGALLQRRAGGSSGVLMATLFTAAGNALVADADWTAAFEAGLVRVQRDGGAAAGDRTLIDALEPALRALHDSGSLQDAARAARAGAQATQAMAARAGRAAYVPQSNLDGVTDPGAEAVARLFERLAEIA
ncbi:dihydroxyacetone kinase subunit DhaK [Lichenicoccus sp.]|uniref:dihydroxyacetone kinase subunit DhaK n=1 Tax=Lichenicoccus sp. TaxID=2781899 RepID=UPI003D126490